MKRISFLLSLLVLLSASILQAQNAFYTFNSLNDKDARGALLHGRDTLFVLIDAEDLYRYDLTNDELDQLYGDAVDSLIPRRMFWDGDSILVVGISRSSNAMKQRLAFSELSPHTGDGIHNKIFAPSLNIISQDQDPYFWLTESQRTSDSIITFAGMMIGDKNFKRVVLYAYNRKSGDTIQWVRPSNSFHRRYVKAPIQGHDKEFFVTSMLHNFGPASIDDINKPGIRVFSFSDSLAPLSAQRLPDYPDNGVFTNATSMLRSSKKDMFWFITEKRIQAQTPSSFVSRGMAILAKRDFITQRFAILDTFFIGKNQQGQRATGVSHRHDSAQTQCFVVGENNNRLLIKMLDDNGNTLWTNEIQKPNLGIDPRHTYTTADSACIISGRASGGTTPGFGSNAQHPFVAIVRDGSPVQFIDVGDSAVTSREGPAEAFSDLRLWPNPATDELHLDGDWPGPATAHLLDATGRRLFSRDGLRPGATLPLPDRVAAGLYFLELRSKSGTAHRRVMLR